MSSPRSAILPVLGVAAAVLLAASIARELAEPYRPDSASETARRRLLRDDYEMSVYVRRGSWAPAGARPYLDVFSEYPQLATWFLGVPYLAVQLPEGDRTTLVKRIEATPPWSTVVLNYGSLMSALMAAAWLGTIAIVAKTAAELGQSRKRAWLLLGPACIYFALQRFDALPALATAASLYAFVRGRPVAGGALLGAGTMLKWYPAIALPLALGFVARRHGGRTAAATLGAFSAVVFACMAPTFLAGFSDPGWTSPNRPAGFAATPFSSGLAAVWLPYAFQGARAPNPGSLAERWVRAALGADDAALRAWLLATKALLAAAAVGLGALAWREASPHRLVAGAAALVTLFVLVNPIFSPQFICWIAPLAAIAGGGRLGRAALGLAIAVDLLTYLQFPWFIFEAPETSAERTLSPGFEVAVQLRLAATVLLVLVLSTLAIRRPTPA